MLFSFSIAFSIIKKTAQFENGAQFENLGELVKNTIFVA